MKRARRANLFLRAVIDPVQAFFQLEAASGILLMIAAVVALVWANSPLGDAYRRLVSLDFNVAVGAREARFTLLQLVNDGLMTLFFFVVGMEIKRELVVGELRAFNRAILPAIAALGGMVVPAVIYVAFNAGKPGVPGWGIPMATDIAFSIGVLTLVPKVPRALVVFLTALAIFDDLGGILVIAFFYGHGLHAWPLASALGVCAALFVLNRAGGRSWLPYFGLGLALWWLLHEGGVHATIAGVILGMAVPARSGRTGREVLEDLHSYAGSLLGEKEDEDLENEQILHIEEKLEDLEPPLNRFVHALHPYVAFAIVPVFALVNSGVSVRGMSLADLAQPIPAGTALGLFLGKQLGIFASTLGAVALGISPMPGDSGRLQLYGVSVVAGIGFTVALFIAALAFPNAPVALDQAKLGILLGSFVSALVGYAILRFASMSADTSHASHVRGRRMS